jgi:hypothetical protein
MGEASEQQ